MTERQEHLLRLLADPADLRVTGLGPADRAAIQEALDEIERLRAALVTRAFLVELPGQGRLF